MEPNEADDNLNDDISDGKDNVADNDHVTGKGASTGEDDTTYSEISSVVKLDDVWTDDTDDNELKKMRSLLMTWVHYCLTTNNLISSCLCI